MSIKIKLIIIVALAALCFIIGAVRYQGVFASIDGKPVTSAAVRAERSSVFAKRGTETPATERDYRSKIASLERFIGLGNTSYGMSATYRFTLGDKQLVAQIDMSYNKQEGTYTLTVANSGDKNDAIFKGFWVADGTYRIITENGKTWLQTDADGSKTEIRENADHPVYDYLAAVRMERAIAFNLFKHTEAVSYRLWEADYFFRLLDENVGSADLIAYQNKPVHYRFHRKNDAGMARHFTIDFYFPPELAGKMASENASAIKRTRKEKSTPFRENGVEIYPDEFAAKKTAIDDFLRSGASYRMKGMFQHGFGLQNWFETQVEMSYNAALDVYRFAVKAKRENGSNVRKNQRMADQHVPDGIYYIVREGDKTYLLSSDLKGKKRKTEEANSGNRIYHLLMEYRMERLVDTNFLTDNDRGDASYFYNYHIRGGGDYFYRYYPNRKNYNALSHKLELKTFQNMPVSFSQTKNIRNTDLGFECEVDFHYDRISQENPTAARWR